MIEQLRVEALETANELIATGEPAAHAHGTVWISAASILGDLTLIPADDDDVVLRMLADVRRVRSAVSSGDIGDAVVHSHRVLHGMARDVLRGDDRFVALVGSLPGSIKTPPPEMIL